MFFLLLLFYGAIFSFPIEILKIQDPSGVASYGYTENAKAYLKSYLITLLLTACAVIIRWLLV